MASDDSDDEPLSILAAAKQLVNSKIAKNITNESEISSELRRRKRRTAKRTQKSPFKKLPLTVKFSTKLKNPTVSTVIQRPQDVWLYLKDFNPTGPYSCLLCPEWFINRSKIVIHYILNHKKDFCGICRYFVPDRKAWIEHQDFHVPWPCSQCVQNFSTEAELRHHLSSSHKLVHCRLCHFRVPDNDQYNTHLFQKHNVTNVASKDEDLLWEAEYEGCSKFLCLLCAKSNNLASNFFNHFMGFHHFTLKCFTSIISGRDIPFTIYGADVSQNFIASLKDEAKCGYVDLDKKQSEDNKEIGANIDTNAMTLITDIKQEQESDTDDIKIEIEEEYPSLSTEHSKSNIDAIKSYKGDEDFDVTLTELVVLQNCYFVYMNQCLKDINANQVPEISNIGYEDMKSDLLEVDCPLCKSKHHTIQALVNHMYRMHSVKSIPVYSCRVCVTTFDTQNELESHVAEELGDFEDLWICQFCDKEFDNREATRKHLTEHWDVMECDNCFSPHLGFKCKFCPTLFWNEPDRETHQVRVHLSKHKDQFYKCEHCSQIFSDKIWFSHHYIEKHYKKELYLLKCCLCCLVLSSIEDMRRHFADQHPEARKVFCSLGACQYKPLSHKKSFQLHLRSQHSTQVRKDLAVNCNVCGREFPSQRACSAHVAQVHGPGKYKCKICKEMLHSMDERKLHYLIRHPGHHPFECTECGKSFQYKSSLYMHKQEHSPNKQSFTCNYCQKVFMKKDSFREHVQIHEGPRHACSYCPMRFVQRSNMLRHERRHTGERPYACPHCPRTFADKGACTSHSRTHSKEASYACIYCGQTFVQKSKLTYHIRKHTGENLETCPVCSKLFTSPCSLREHMKVHDETRKKSVNCPLCDRKYQDERYMLRHLRTSHTNGHFTCPLCNKGLTSAAGLRHHVITHSPLNVFRCKACPKSYAVKRTMVKHLRKRHNLKSGDVNLREFYQKLEPSECQLGLDEEVLNSIFGPPKKTVNDILIGDFVSFTNTMKLAEDLQREVQKKNEEADEDCDDDGDDNDDEDDSQGHDSDEESQEKNDTNQGNNSAEELEPTDFVSVKIEPMDEDELKGD